MVKQGGCESLVWDSLVTKFWFCFEAPAEQHGWHDEFAAFQASHPGQLEMSQKEKEAFEMAFEQAKQGKWIRVRQKNQSLMNDLQSGAQINWEQEFEAQQSNDAWAKEFEQQENSTTSASDKEALARTAAMLLETVDTESNPKFKQSNFMALMHKLRNKEVSIEGNKMVETKGKNVGGDWASEFGQRYEGRNATRSWADDFVQQAGSSSSGNMWKDEFARNAERSWAEDFAVSHNHGGESSSSTAIPSGGDWAAEFNRATNGAGQASQSDMERIFGKGTEMDDWVQQYNENIAHLKTSKDAEWDDMQKDWERFKPEQGLGYRAVNPEYDTYNFMTDNPYLVNPDAIDRVEHNSLADSILALEAKAQLQANDASAWQQLGFRQQENERDGAAIAALRRAVSLDPGMLDCWLALAVSYTNENCRADAYDALEQWISNNEKYQHLARSSGKSRMAADRHAYITNMFLEAARSAPGEEMDADVQVGLGVLFNVSEEYHKAIDCFKAALQSRPQDYLLWNKLGATLANSRDTPGAIEAYFNALEINPSYVRARYNLAISCINLGQNQEAAEHLLTALMLQQSAEASVPAAVMLDDRGNKISVPNGMSDNVWDSLRMVMFM